MSRFLSSDMENDRRSFVKLVSAAASASLLSGCLDGNQNNPENGTGDGDGDGSDTPEPAEFGYKTWVPAGEYANLGYADLARLREYASLEIDSETASVVGDVGPQYADVNAYISTDSTGAFDAYHGSFDADALTTDITDQLTETEETENERYTVITGTKTDEEGEPTDETVEAVVSDSFVVSSESDEGAVRVLDAALGETEREVNTVRGSELIQGLDEHADNPPFVVFNYGTKNAAYTFIEENEEGSLEFVEVAFNEAWSEETAEEVRREFDCQSKYNDTSELENCASAEREGTTVIITSEAEDLSGYIETYL